MERLSLVESKLVNRGTLQGFTLAELIITMALAGVILTLLLMGAGRVSTTSASLSQRNQILVDTDALFNQIRSELENASWINPTSHSKKLLFTTITASGTPVNKGYRLRTVSGSEILEMSEDGGTTWSTPFDAGTSNNYTVTGAKFLYCGVPRNCTEFTDTNGNGDYQAGVDAAPVRFTDTGGVYTGTALSSPLDANRVAWQDFRFTFTAGNKPLTVSWGYAWFEANRFYRQVAPTSTLAQKFSSTGTGSSFNNSFNVRGLAWDYINNCLLVSGRQTGRDAVYMVNREGVGINQKVMLVPNNSYGSRGINTVDDVAVEKDGATGYVLDIANNVVAKVRLSNGQLINTPKRLTSLLTSTAAIAYDPNSQDSLFAIGLLSGSGRIVQFNKNTMSLINSWSLPATLTTPTDFFVEPLSGDFYVVNNVVSGTGSSRTINVFQVTRSNPTNTSTFSINLADIGSSATNVTSNNWGLAYDGTTNHLFLSDTYSDQVYELIPPQLLYPAS